MTPEQEIALRTARALLDVGHPLQAVLSNDLIPIELRAFVREEIERDRNFELRPARLILADRDRSDWLRAVDRDAWYYWPTLRQYLIRTKGWKASAVRSLDDSSDDILRQLEPPSEDTFDTRGLVLGFVQSGKTANYTAVIAKAADAGYRLIVVLSGMDKGLRRQTNIRLKNELVGYADARAGTVPLPPVGQQWHEFTTDDIDGDFRPGNANHAALQGSQPVLLVVKKNGPVLRRLLRWLDDAPTDVRRTLATLVVDDEADQASVDTRGSYQSEDDPPDPDYEPPSVINGLIRDLLGRFARCSYVAYTATPFANILIPHDTSDPTVGNDLYPRDFIVDLPKPDGYFGAEEIFGRWDAEVGDNVGGLDIIREVPDDDIVSLNAGTLSESLEAALIDFTLAGAARACRGNGDAPATMLVHSSHRVHFQALVRQVIQDRYSDLRDEWRYQRRHGVRERLAARWEAEFRPITRSAAPHLDTSFDSVEPFVGPFLEAVQVKEINSATGEVLDYDRDSSLKAIAIGGNRLSRGLTLEGLLTSYFIRPSASYDTLMQMGRWFGFREGYEDLTRIWTTAELAGWFSDLALVEHRLREDIDVYESQGLTPRQVGMRIWQHPAMQVTSPLKRRFASQTVISQTYSGHLEQTFKFPFRRPQDLAEQMDANVAAIKEFVSTLGDVDGTLNQDKGPIWTGVGARAIMDFLNSFQVDQEVRSLSLPLISTYIRRAEAEGELVNWTVAVRGLKRGDPRLGDADWGLPGGPIHQISRSRLEHSDSLGVITDPEDEAIGLDVDQRGKAARHARSPDNGLLLLYPISRHSGSDLVVKESPRRPLFRDPQAEHARDLIGLALSFPRSEQPQEVEAYLEGTVSWRPIGE